MNVLLNNVSVDEIKIKNLLGEELKLIPKSLLSSEQSAILTSFVEDNPFETVRIPELDYEYIIEIGTNIPLGEEKEIINIKTKESIQKTTVLLELFSELLNFD